jgi:hypothetical protein
VFWLALHFTLDMERRLHDVYEKKRYIIDYIERFSFIIGDGTVAGVYWGTGRERFLSIFLLSGGQGVGVNKWLRYLYDVRFGCRGLVLLSDDTGWCIYGSDGSMSHLGWVDDKRRQRLGIHPLEFYVVSYTFS